MTNITFQPATLGALSVKVREATVGLETALTNWGREAVAGLLTNGTTIAAISVAMHAAYGTKNTPSGKPVDKTNPGHLRYAKGGKGGDNARKAVTALKDTFDSIDVDGVRSILIGYVLQQTDAPAKFWGMIKAVKAAVTAAAEAAAAIEADPADVTEAAAAEAAKSAPEALTVADLANRLILALTDGAALTAADLDRLKTLTAAIDAATAATVELAEAA